MRTVVVVGASLAGVRAAEAMRQEGFDGRLVMLGDEDRPPYDRPPLSKQVLDGTWEPDRANLRIVGGEIGSLDAEWVVGSAVDLDPVERSVGLAGGARLPFDGLVIATGASPRALGGPAPEGVQVLRSLDDCHALRRALLAAPARLVVVGAGFIGCEVASSARRLGVAVTVVDPAPRPMSTALDAEAAAVCAAMQRDAGVDLRLGVGVAGFVADAGGHLAAVELDDGTRIEAQVAVVGIGARPNTGWLEGSGLTIDDGVVCDACCRAAPGIVAAGDVARWPSGRNGTLVRLEHWSNAQEQGGHAGRVLLRGDAATPLEHAYDPVPTFWSDQFGTSIQLAGRCAGVDERLVVEGSYEDRTFTAIYRRGSQIVGALTFGMPRAALRYRKLIERRARWAEAVDATV